MDSSLFHLISVAGSMSLDEVRVRSSDDNQGLAYRLGNMVSAGNVALSFPQSQSPLTSMLSSLVSENRRDIDRTKLATILSEVLKNPEEASEITISPTTMGYKLAIS